MNLQKCFIRNFNTNFISKLRSAAWQLRKFLIRRQTNVQKDRKNPCDAAHGNNWLTSSLMFKVFFWTEIQAQSKLYSRG